VCLEGGVVAPALTDALVLQLSAAYAVGWWSFVWLVLGRPRLPHSSPGVAVLVLGFDIVWPLHIYGEAEHLSQLPAPPQFVQVLRATACVVACAPFPLLGLAGVGMAVRRLVQSFLNTD
jgi:hypothetical protein